MTASPDRPLAHDTLHDKEPAMNSMLDRTDEAIDSARRVADDTLQTLHERASRLRDRAMDLRDDMRTQVETAGERTVGYVKDEPVKSMLIAAAAGAVLALLVGAIAKRRS